MPSLLQRLGTAFSRVRFSVDSLAVAQPTSGLIVVEYHTTAAAPLEADLLVFRPGEAEPAFRKSLRLTARSSGWIGIHGHLLPNGSNTLRFELRAARGRRLAEQSLTLLVRNEGPVAAQVRASLISREVPFILDGVCDSGTYDYADPGLVAWFDRSPDAINTHLESLALTGEVEPDEVEALNFFAENGYLVLPDLVDPEHLGQLNVAIDDAVDKKIEGYEWGSSQRIHNLHAQYPAIRDLWLHPKVLRMLNLIFGVPARPCQSLTYVFGSQQEHHQDTIHLTPFPAGRMCGVWTALEDVQPESGELIVFPRSHKLPRIYMDTVGLTKVTEDWQPFQEKVVSRWTDLIVAHGFERVTYRPKAGTVLIWHENLMHAGSPRADLSKSRRSIVGHYFAEGAIVYYDSSGLAGSVYEGELA